MAIGPVSLVEWRSGPAARPSGRLRAPRAAARSGLRMKLGSASVTSSVLEGSRAGSQGGQGSVTALPSAVRSRSWASSSRAGDAVDDGVVDLGDEPDAAVGHALDDVHLPGRLVRRERAAHHLGHQVVNSASPPGAGRAPPVEMVARSNSGSSTQRG